MIYILHAEHEIISIEKIDFLKIPAQLLQDSFLKQFNTFSDIPRAADKINHIDPNHVEPIQVPVPAALRSASRFFCLSLSSIVKAARNFETIR